MGKGSINFSLRTFSLSPFSSKQIFFHILISVHHLPSSSPSVISVDRRPYFNFEETLKNWQAQSKKENPEAVVLSLSSTDPPFIFSITFFMMWIESYA
ncbi:hypothetical protein E1A91_D06G156100v1 [Gossypium mustelinum]|uniref:Uncharacterized protein n=1 Tax=Gossypium mustelinum TaxID=34275 RepID=A0A5D2UIS1_GOSMU|nr:hypothetical protein E1A91_D06G156100v1 [Gossypium mustelinum]